MIFGIGVDQIRIERIKNLLIQHSDKFKKRIFTECEINYCDAAPQLSAARYAKRFAAKEACLKAAGTGYRNGISWQDMEITNNDLGQPQLRIQGTLKVHLENQLTQRPLHVHLSLTDTDTDATAFVIIEALEKQYPFNT